jgi:hypothetical protein
LKPGFMPGFFCAPKKARRETSRASCTLYPGDWCVHDTRQPLRIDALDRRNENLSVRLESPSDAETLSLLSNVAARRWSAATGTSRILRAIVAETFESGHALSFGQTWKQVGGLSDFDMR